MEIVFKNYDLRNDLDLLNKTLARASKDRFELRQDTKNRYYLYDYDFKEVSRSKDEIKDIIECMNLQDYTTKENYLRIENKLKEVF